MITKLQAKIKQNKLDGLWVTNPHTIQHLIGINLDPMERFLGLFITPSKVVLCGNVLFVLEESDQYQLVTHYDHHDIAQVVLDLSEGHTIGIDQWMAARFCDKLYRHKEVVVASNLVDELLAIKNGEEIEKMKKSSLVNDQVMAIVPSLLKPNVSEIQVAQQIHDLFIQFGASDNSFETIVAFGAHGADPHAVCDNRTLQPGDSIIVDMGCIVDGYCSDMTRTFFYQKNTAEKAYEVCLKANIEAIKAIKPGAKFSDLDKVARQIITEAGYGDCFFHRLGHGIGKQVHEPFDVSSNNDQLILPGMCFSIEPGIYVKGQFGIRIEDLVYVDENGYGKLLNNAPKNAIII